MTVLVGELDGVSSGKQDIAGGGNRGALLVEIHILLYVTLAQVATNTGRTTTLSNTKHGR